MLRPSRLLALGGVVLLGFLYWKPVHTFLSTQQELRQRQDEVGRLAVGARSAAGRSRGPPRAGG